MATPLEIRTTIDGTEATLVLTGKLTAMTAPELEQTLSDRIPAAVTHVTFDMDDLEYIASAGLRVLVGTEKTMQGRGGHITLSKPNDEVYEVLEMTGLAELFDIEH